MLQQKKGWGKNVIVMYTCKDNLTPLLYSGKIKKKKLKKIIIIFDKGKKKKKKVYSASISGKPGQLHAKQ